LSQPIDEFSSIIEDAGVQNDEVDVQLDSAAGLRCAGILAGGRGRRGLNLNLS